MKRMLKRALCVLLSVLMALPACVVSQATDEYSHTPVVYVEGQGFAIYDKIGTPEEKQVYPLTVPEGYIEEKIDMYLPVFAEAVFTQEWDEFGVALYDSIVPIFEDIQLDNNGNPPEGNGIKWTWTRESLRAEKTENGYHVEQFTFHYDWRLDPVDNAKILRRYIEDVMYVTGASEVALLGRCLGANIVAAYMTEYDGEYISDCILYASALNGVTILTQSFCGDFKLEADGLERFMYDMDLSADYYMNQLITSFITVFNKTYGLDLTLAAFNNVYPDIRLDIVPPILRETFGSFPGYWSMVDVENFNRAVETVFYGVDKADYSGLINRINYYRDNIQVPVFDTFKALSEKGVEFSNISKYGIQVIPIGDGQEIISDGFVEIGQCTMGATSAQIGQTFSDEYMEAAAAGGSDVYISPDRQIDASTALFPDSTWFIKNLHHSEFPKHINCLISEIVSVERFTVFENPDFPQYLVYEEETDLIVPMVSENKDTTTRWDVSLFEAIKRFIESIYNILLAYIEQLRTQQ